MERYKVRLIHIYKKIQLDLKAEYTEESAQSCLKSCSILNVLILQNIAWLPLLLRKMGVHNLHNLSTNTELLTNKYLPHPSTKKKKYEGKKKTENNKKSTFQMFFALTSYLHYPTLLPVVPLAEKSCQRQCPPLHI